MILPTILTASGRYFDFTEPQQDSIDVGDIATALSRICRFTGHTTEPYSVAQHSVSVSYLVPKEYALQGLLHDASEAYLGDVSSPLKQMLPDYKIIEKRVEAAVMLRFGLPFPLHPSIKQADLRMLVTEKRDLMPKPLWEEISIDKEAWSPFDGVDELPFRIFPIGHQAAMFAFIERFYELTN